MRAPCTMMNLHRHLPGSEIDWTKNGYPFLRVSERIRMICRKGKNQDGTNNGWNYRVFIDNSPHDTRDFWEAKRLMGG